MMPSVRPMMPLSGVRSSCVMACTTHPHPIERRPQLVRHRLRVRLGGGGGGYWRGLVCSFSGPCIHNRQLARVYYSSSGPCIHSWRVFGGGVCVNLSFAGALDSRQRTSP